MTTARSRRWWIDLKEMDATHELFITKERVCLSWPILPESFHTASSLSNMSVINQIYSKMERDGGCHVIPPRWRTGAEHHLAVVSAHAGWTSHVQVMVAVTVVRKTKHGVKRAVSWLPVIQLRFGDTGTKKGTSRWGNWSAMAQHKHLGFTHKNLFLL